jgi:hypothetical protein
MGRSPCTDTRSTARPPTTDPPALSKIAMHTSVEDDFDGGLRMLLDGIALRDQRC